MSPLTWMIQMTRCSSKESLSSIKLDLTLVTLNAGSRSQRKVSDSSRIDLMLSHSRKDPWLQCLSSLSWKSKEWTSIYFSIRKSRKEQISSDPISSKSSSRMISSIPIWDLIGKWESNLQDFQSMTVLDNHQQAMSQLLHHTEWLTSLLLTLKAS